MAAKVSAISVTLGDTGTVVTVRPDVKWGDNPRFYADQAEKSILESIPKIRAMIEAIHPSQLQDSV